MLNSTQNMEYVADIVQTAYIYTAINIGPMTRLTHCQHADGTDLSTRFKLRAVAYSCGQAEEIVTLYNTTTGRNNQKYQTDKAENPRNWLHPADIVSNNDTKDGGEEQLWHIFTDGSKSEQGLRSGVAVFIGKVLTEELKFKLDNRCSNNQAEQLAIVKALEATETQHVNHNEHRAAVIYTDSKITLD